MLRGKNTKNRLKMSILKTQKCFKVLRPKHSSFKKSPNAFIYRVSCGSRGHHPQKNQVLKMLKRYKVEVLCLFKPPEQKNAERTLKILKGPFGRFLSLSLSLALSLCALSLFPALAPSFRKVLPPPVGEWESMTP